MKRDLVLWVFLVALVTLTAGKPRRRRDHFGTADSTKPWKIQRVGNEFRRAVPSGYSVRSGDCPGNDIWALYRSRTTLKECARLCSSSTKCQAFMLYNNRTCYPKTKSCPTTNKSNPLNVFYDKVPSGYTMRPGDCSGNDIWGIHGFVSLSECANRCNGDSRCVSFMYYDNKECFPKTKTCAKPSTANPKNVFYDKIKHTIPRGYEMRPGDCPGNDIWSLHGFVSLAECARRCNGNPGCVSFMFYDGRECYPKTKTCPTTDKTNAKNFFYDKIKII